MDTPLFNQILNIILLETTPNNILDECLLHLGYLSIYVIFNFPVAFFLLVIISIFKCVCSQGCFDLVVIRQYPSRFHVILDLGRNLCKEFRTICFVIVFVLTKWHKLYDIALGFVAKLVHKCDITILIFFTIQKFKLFKF